MANRLVQVECAPECGFLLRSHDETELTYFVISHCKNAHNKTLAREEVRGLIKPATVIA